MSPPFGIMTLLDPLATIKKVDVGEEQELVVVTDVVTDDVVVLLPELGTGVADIETPDEVACLARRSSLLATAEA